MQFTLTEEQSLALSALKGDRNIFLTGGAGSGKSFLIRHYRSSLVNKEHPILASTGAAAVLIGGRTFHSFFGLGIMEGGPQATLHKALKDKRLIKRLNKIKGFILDEVSMIPGAALATAELITRFARESDEPWGGLRAIIVGDFAQLPPVTRMQKTKPWAFLDPIWERSELKPVVLTQNIRTPDQEYVSILNQVRKGIVSTKVEKFLNHHTIDDSSALEGTRLFPLKEQTEKFNQWCLNKLPEEPTIIPTEYAGDGKYIESLKRYSPLPEVLVIKRWARVMIIQNDPQLRWVNGSQGHIAQIFPDRIIINLDSGREVELEKTTFTLLNADEKPVAAVSNFPLILSYAITIHKSQGVTLDKMIVNLNGLWEPGHAYVALSRLRSSEGLYIEGWQTKSIQADPVVTKFYESLS